MTKLVNLATRKMSDPKDLKKPNLKLNKMRYWIRPKSFDIGWTRLDAPLGKPQLEDLELEEVDEYPDEDPEGKDPNPSDSMG